MGPDVQGGEQSILRADLHRHLHELADGLEATARGEGEGQERSDCDGWLTDEKTTHWLVLSVVINSACSKPGWNTSRVVAATTPVITHSG